MLCGKKMLGLTIYVVTCITVILVLFTLIFQYIIPNGADDYVIIVVFVISLIAGLFAGYFANKAKEIAFSIVLGFAVALIAGQVLFNAVFQWFEGSNPKTVQMIVYIVLIAVFGIFGYCLFDLFVIIGTSLLGSYAVVRGASFFIGGFPSETVIMDLLSRQEFEQVKTMMSGVVYAYLAVWIIFSIAAMVFQKKSSKEDKDKN